MEIDKIKKVMMGKASREEREEVESWAGRLNGSDLWKMPGGSMPGRKSPMGK